MKNKYNLTGFQNSKFTNGIKYYVILVFILFIASCNNSSSFESQSESSDNTSTEELSSETDGESSEEFTEADREAGNAELAEQREREWYYRNQDEMESVKKSKNHFWNCGYCREIREKNEEPPKYSGDCERRDERRDIFSHLWYDLGTVGDRTFRCKICNAQINLKDEPNMVWSGCYYIDGGNQHKWQEIDY